MSSRSKMDVALLTNVFLLDLSNSYLHTWMGTGVYDCFACLSLKTNVTSFLFSRLGFIGRGFWRWSCANTPLLPFRWFPVALKMIYKLHFHFIGYPAVTRLVFITDLPQRYCFSFSCVCYISGHVTCSRNGGLLSLIHW